MPTIPRLIFTIWLDDGKPVLDLIAQCIETQREVKGYKHRLLTTEDFPPNLPYFKDALSARNWTKAADYGRLWYLLEHGGIYCDADMEILPGKSFDELLDYSLVVCQEETWWIANSIMLAVPRHPIIQRLLQDMEMLYRGDDESVNPFEPSMAFMTPIIYEAAHGDPRTLWLGPGQSSRDASIKILPPEYFMPYRHDTGKIKVTDKTIAFHHFNSRGKRQTLYAPRPQTA